MLFLLLFPEVWDIISLRHNLTAMYGMVCVFCFGKNACPIFACHFVHWESCVAAIGATFFGAWLRLRTFFGEERKMFEEPGHKLKTVAKILCWLGIIGTVIAAVTLGKDRYGDLDLLSFALILVIGCVTSYISSLVLYGFGEMIENTSGISGHTSRILVKLEGIEQSAGQHSTDKSSAESNHPSNSSLGARTSAELDLKSKGLIRCPECGTIQSIDRESCYCCGNKL